MSDEASPLVRFIISLSGGIVKPSQARYVIFVLVALLIFAAFYNFIGGSEVPGQKPEPLPEFHHNEK